MNAKLPIDTPTETASASVLERRLPTPAELCRQLPIDDAIRSQISSHRQAIHNILEGHDDRLLVVVGPCSIHDPRAALEYAERLAKLARRVEDRLLLVMRVYVEKPRTTIGWKGLAYDPHLDGSDDMAGGLTLSRRLMRDIAALGLPIASELLQPMAAAYFEDLLAWVAIGARTTESQIHRELASGLAAAVGFKNGTDGSVNVAIDAMRAAAYAHRHFAMGLHGQPVMRETHGNPHTHLVLRGGHGATNYDARSVRASRQALRDGGFEPRIMVDCSHANSCKDHRRQSEVMLDVVSQRIAGDTSLIGVMLEGHLHEGKQSLGDGPLHYGVSITDACLDWETTEQLLESAAERLKACQDKSASRDGIAVPA